MGLETIDGRINIPGGQVFQDLLMLLGIMVRDSIVKLAGELGVIDDGVILATLKHAHKLFITAWCQTIDVEIPFQTHALFGGRIREKLDFLGGALQPCAQELTRQVGCGQPQCIGFEKSANVIAVGDGLCRHRHGVPLGTAVMLDQPIDLQLGDDLLGNRAADAVVAGQSGLKEPEPAMNSALDKLLLDLVIDGAPDGDSAKRFAVGPVLQGSREAESCGVEIKLDGRRLPIAR